MVEDLCRRHRNLWVLLTGGCAVEHIDPAWLHEGEREILATPFRMGPAR